MHPNEGIRRNSQPNQMPRDAIGTLIKLGVADPGILEGNGKGIWRLPGLFLEEYSEGTFEQRPRGGVT
jgi:hypothetical protein